MFDRVNEEFVRRKGIRESIIEVYDCGTVRTKNLTSTGHLSPLILPISGQFHTRLNKKLNPSTGE